MPFRGNPRALRKFAKQLREIGSAKTRAKLIRAVAEECMTQVQLGFIHGVSPFGVPWKAARRGGMTLVSTGRLRSSIRPSFDAGFTNFSLATNLKYANIHNRGGVIKAKGVQTTFRVAKNSRGVRAIRTRRSGSDWLTFKVGGQWVRVKEVHMPRRQFLPYPGQMPARWVPGIQRAMDAVFRNVMR